MTMLNEMAKEISVLKTFLAAIGRYSDREYAVIECPTQQQMLDFAAAKEIELDVKDFQAFCYTIWEMDTFGFNCKGIREVTIVCPVGNKGAFIHELTHAMDNLLVNEQGFTNRLTPYFDRQTEVLAYFVQTKFQAGLLKEEHLGKIVSDWQDYVASQKYRRTVRYEAFALLGCKQSIGGFTNRLLNKIACWTVKMTNNKNKKREAKI